MSKETTPRVSFSLPPAASSPAVTPPSDGDSGNTAEDGGAKPEFIDFFDASLTLDAKPVIIPPLPDARMKKVPSFPESEEDYDSWKFREDVKELPEHRGMEEFSQLSVEHFPFAYLAGYGWSQGQVIGRNKMLQDPKVIEYSGRRVKAGLGYHKPKSGN